MAEIAELFGDRRDAGERLAGRLAHLGDRLPVVVALPRGGLPVAEPVADALGAPLDVIMVAKLGVPFQPELAMGALGEDGVRVVDSTLVATLGITPAELEAVESRTRVDLERRVRRYRGVISRIPLEERTAIIVDDGIATGSTARAACRVAQAAGAQRVILAAPVAPTGVAEQMARDDAIDEVIVIAERDDFVAVGQWYRDFRPVSDDQALEILRRAAARRLRSVSGASVEILVDTEVEIEIEQATLHGRLAIPAQATGLVIFAHGSGSSRHSPRNRFVADRLQMAGHATLLFDLLTETEESDRSLVFDIDELADRLVQVTDWARDRPETRGLRFGYFGASTGAAAALVAAAETDVAAVVSRGGRPDLALDVINQVMAPTLLIVGGDDHVVLDMNRQAFTRLRGERRLEVVTGASHLFSEPGTLEAVADLAVGWFDRHLRPAISPP